jgi:hypothetical protein
LLQISTHARCSGQRADVGLALAAGVVPAGPKYHYAFPAFPKCVIVAPAGPKYHYAFPEFPKCVIVAPAGPKYHYAFPAFPKCVIVAPAGPLRAAARGHVDVASVVSFSVESAG